MPRREPAGGGALLQLLLFVLGSSGVFISLGGYVHSLQGGGWQVRVGGGSARRGQASVGRG